MDSASDARREHSPEYVAYISSDTWWRFRMLYWRKHDRKCAACGALSGIDLHHVTYHRLGHEHADDVVPLCRSCHDAVHLAHRQGGGALSGATWRYIAGRTRREARRVVPVWAEGGKPKQRGRPLPQHRKPKREPLPPQLTRKEKARAAQEAANLVLAQRQAELRARLGYGATNRTRPEPSEYPHSRGTEPA